MDIQIPAGFTKIKEFFLYRMGTSRNMALAALALWCCSLPLTVFYMGTRYRSYDWLGWQAFINAWIAPLDGYFGWYANVFFFFSFFRLWVGKIPSISILLAVLLAFDSFRFSSITEFSFSSDGITHFLHGYGWGMLLWFLAIFLLLAAVGKRRRELVEQDGNRSEWLFPAGLTLCGIALGAAFYCFVHDRMIDPAVAKPIQELSGPVEIIPAKAEAEPGPISPFDDVGMLLFFGISAIRFGDVDYSYEADGTIRAVPAVDQPAAILTAGRRADQSIVVKLVETKNNRLVFEQSWGKDGMLPGNSKFGRRPFEYIYGGKQPRQLVMQALGFPDRGFGWKWIQDKQEKNINYKKIEPIRYLGSITGQEEEGGPSETAESLKKPMNSNCPTDVGLGDSVSRTFEFSRFFQIKQKKWYRGNALFVPNSAFCDGNRVYLLPEDLWDERRYLNLEQQRGIENFKKIYLEQRDLENFQKIWAGVILFPDAVFASIKDRSFGLLSLSRDGEILHLRLVDRKSGRIFTVQATPKQ